MIIIWVTLWSIILTLVELHDDKNFLEQNDKALKNILKKQTQHNHKGHHRHHKGDKDLDYWTKGEGRNVLERVRKEFLKNQNLNNYQNLHPSIDFRMGFITDDNDDDHSRIVLIDDINNVPSEGIDPPEPSTKSNKPTKIKECIPSVTTVKGKQTCKNQLIFNDSFQTLSKNKWNVDQKIAGAPDYEFVAYVDRPQTREIILGTSINLKPVLTEKMFGPEIFTSGIDFGENCTEKVKLKDCKMKPDAGFMVPPVASCQINTKNNFFFKYGNVEIRAKLPTGDWIYPILYLNPENEEYGKYYKSGQIRIAFIEGNAANNKILKSGIVFSDDNNNRYYEMRNITSNNSWSDTFHKYQLQWTPESIIVGVDGDEYGRIEPPEGGFETLLDKSKLSNFAPWKNASNLAPFDKEMYLQVGVGVGGFNFEDRSDGTKPWRNKERLQTKRFYQAKDKWIDSWTDENISLKIDYIKISAL